MMFSELMIEGVQLPKVSVVIGNYNQGAFVESAIKSVAGQSYTNFECVVVDDSSTDDSSDRITALLEAIKDDRFRFIQSETNGGQMVTMMTGLEATSAPFVTFLDADDLWEPEKTECQVAYLLEHPEAQAVCCWHDLFGDEARVSHENRMWNYQTYTDSVCKRSDLIKELSFQTSTLLMRHDYYRKIGGMDEDPRLLSGHKQPF